MTVVGLWTGKQASALRLAMRLTIEAFAESLGTSVRTVAKWNTEPEVVPVTELQRALDTVLARASDDVRARFSQVMGSSHSATESVKATPNPVLEGALLRLQHDPAVENIRDWLEENADWPMGESRNRIAKVLEELDIDWVRTRARRRGRVHRDGIAAAVESYYGPVDGHALYRVAGDGRRITTSVLTRDSWVDLSLPIGRGRDRLVLTADDKQPPLPDETAVDGALRRVAETLATDTQLINRPLYRLREVDVSREGIRGVLSVTDFASYALTLDLLEGELLDALADGRSVRPGSLPLRDRYLPDTMSTVRIDERLCAGGPLALFAVARPGQSRRSDPDYLLLVQERSGRVLNAARRLAVIPKSFHEPLVDFSDDAQISATLERELEEELFGRVDLDTTRQERRHADPLHLSRLSEPMRWLLDHSDGTQWRMECTGFGYNLISGNFEFASLIVIDDEEWWSQFGGYVEASWEVEGLRRYSSRDTAGLTRLMHDGTWSNEGLFAFIQGLRRLAETGGDRVAPPTIELEL